jgi:hypothetical protein
VLFGAASADKHAVAREHACLPERPVNEILKSLDRFYGGHTWCFSLGDRVVAHNLLARRVKNGFEACNLPVVNSNYAVDRVHQKTATFLLGL